ncbi:MAG: ABC transporter substrate-binding protein [Casimicrobium sp.]
MTDAASKSTTNSSEIRIGQSTVLSGPLSSSALAHRQGAVLCFDSVNASGGINGRPIRLTSLDDGLNPEKAIINYRKLIFEERVLAMFGGGGTATTLAVVPMLEESRTPLVAPYAVGDAGRAKSGSLVFYLRARYSDESEKIIRHLSKLNLDRIALVSLNTPGGKEVTASVEQQVAMHLRAKLVASTAIEINGSNISDVVRASVAAAPNAVILFAAGGAAVKFVSEFKNAGAMAQIYAMSIAPAELIHKALNKNAKGIVFSQVTAYPWNRTLPVVREYQALAKVVGLEPSYLSLEGYVAGKFLVQALTRAGSNLNRERLTAALAQREVNIGGAEFFFSPERRTGTDFVELVMLSADGKFVR